MAEDTEAIKANLEAIGIAIGDANADIEAIAQRVERQATQT